MRASSQEKSAFVGANKQQTVGVEAQAGCHKLHLESRKCGATTALSILSHITADSLVIGCPVLGHVLVLDRVAIAAHGTFPERPTFDILMPIRLPFPTMLS
jgi:hypothetical protein